MVKTKYILLFSILLSIISSCKKSEDIHRDLILQTEGIDFDIPILPISLDPVSLGEISTEADVNEMISQNAGQFTTDNLQSMKISGFQIEIAVDPEAEEDLVNNFKAFDYIRVELKKPNKELLEVGRIINSAMQKTTSIQVPITTTQELKDEFSTGVLTYVITGVTSTATTKIMNARAIAQYKLTLER